MEPLAHTLAGACLAETGLKRVTPLAAGTLLIAANLPDLDGACYLHGADAAFGFRRGLTHGVAAWLILPVVLTALVLAYDRFVRRRRHDHADPARPWPLFWLSLLGVLSHPFLDWLNSYGIRLLMPFSDRWFYGDALFIVDPWLWLLFGSAVMLAWTTRRSGVVLWIAIGCATTVLIALNPLVPEWSRITWVAALAALVAGRFLIKPSAAGTLAKAGVALAALYIATMYAGSRLAEDAVRNRAAMSGWQPVRVAAMPVPVDPFGRVVIVDTPTRYILVPIRLTSLLGVFRGARDVAIADRPETIAKGPSHPAIDAALSLPRLQGTRRWLRFPSYEVNARPDGGYTVIIRDARFSVGTPPGFGVIAVVELDAALKPVTSSSSP